MNRVIDFDETGIVIDFDPIADFVDEFDNPDVDGELLDYVVDVFEWADDYKFDDFLSNAINANFNLFSVNPFALI